MELDDKLYKKLTAICEKGDKYEDRGKHEKALECYKRGLAMLPEPVYEWAAAAWCYAAIGDMQYFQGKNDEALDSFMQAMKCPDGINP